MNWHRTCVAHGAGPGPSEADTACGTIPDQPDCALHILDLACVRGSVVLTWAVDQLCTTHQACGAR